MIKHLDHLVITTANLEHCIDFYTRILGMRFETFLAGSPPSARPALCFGNQKINLHIAGAEFKPCADKPTCGSQDLCFMLDTPLETMMQHLTKQNWPILQGPVSRAGATGNIRSVYIRDPDQNLIELCEPA